MHMVQRAVNRYGHARQLCCLHQHPHGFQRLFNVMICVKADARGVPRALWTDTCTVLPRGICTLGWCPGC